MAGRTPGEKAYIWSTDRLIAMGQTVLIPGIFSALGVGVAAAEGWFGNADGIDIKLGNYIDIPLAWAVTWIGLTVLQKIAIHWYFAEYYKGGNKH
jgi:hypothetical protein